MRDRHAGFVHPTPANSAANSLRLSTEYSKLVLSLLRRRTFLVELRQHTGWAKLRLVKFKVQSLLQAFNSVQNELFRQ